MQHSQKSGKQPSSDMFVRKTNKLNSEFYTSVGYHSHIKPAVRAVDTAAVPSCMLLIMTTVQLHFVLSFSL